MCERPIFQRQRKRPSSQAQADRSIRARIHIKTHQQKRYNAPWRAADAIRVLAMTGARRGEIAGLQWKHLDLDAGTITLPPNRHKTGKRTGKPRIITLPAAAQPIIERQPAGNPDDFVFRPAKGSGAISLTRVWHKVRSEAGLPDGIGLHGLRHSLGSLMAVSGMEAAQIAEQLGHRQLHTTQKYIHFAKDARKALAERAAGPVTAALNKAAKTEATS